MPKVVPEYKEEARKKIIAAGHEVMSRKGYQATTMDDIARDVGVSKATLYLYFDSKDDLVIEIVKAFPEQVREIMMSMYPAAAPIDAWIAVLDFYLENTAEQNALFFELLSMIPRNPEIAKSFSENLRLGLPKCTLGFAEQQRQGIVSPDADPRTIALAMMSLFHGLRVLSLIGVDRGELRERWIEIGKLLFGYNVKSPENAGKGRKAKQKSAVRSHIKKVP
jgi:AcrR family transcriptional regulator